MESLTEGDGFFNHFSTIFQPHPQILSLEIAGILSSDMIGGV